MLEALTGLAEGRIPAQLVCCGLTSMGVVLFDFNPEQITMTRIAQTKPEGEKEYFSKSDPPTVKLDGLVFDGPDTKPKCDRLLNWLTPDGSMLDGLLAGAMPLSIKSVTGKLGIGRKIGGLMLSPFRNYTKKLPLLTFNWGPPIAGFFYDVNLKSVTITYTRFSKLGIPVRAKVNMELKEVPSILSTLPTNPTSGGPPGRAGHCVSEQETLPGIALRHYGRQGGWCRLAEVNDIEDPMRVRPGDSLYLPNPDELHERERS